MDSVTSILLNVFYDPGNTKRKFKIELLQVETHSRFIVL